MINLKNTINEILYSSTDLWRRGLSKVYDLFIKFPWIFFGLMGLSLTGWLSLLIIDIYYYGMNPMNIVQIAVSAVILMLSASVLYRHWGLHRALKYISLGNDTKAFFILRRFTRRKWLSKKVKPFAFFNLGDCSLRIKNYEYAEVAYKKLLFDISNVHYSLKIFAWEGLIISYINQLKLEDAEIALESIKGMELDRFHKLYLELLDLYLHLKWGDFDVVLKDPINTVDKFIEYPYEMLSLYCAFLSLTYYKIGSNREFKYFLQKALKLRSSYSISYIFPEINNLISEEVMDNEEAKNEKLQH